MRNQVVSALALKNAGKLIGPVGVVDLKAVAKNRTQSVGWNTGQKLVAHGNEISLGRCSIVMIQHQPFGAHRRAFHLHARGRGIKNLNLTASSKWRDGTVGAYGDASDRARAPIESRDYFGVLFERRELNRLGSRDRNADAMQSVGAIGKRDRRT